MGSKCTITIAPSKRNKCGGTVWDLEKDAKLVVHHTAHFVADYVQEKAHIGRLQLLFFYQRHTIAYMNF